MLKDAMLAIMIVFVAQMSVTDWSTLKRILLVTLLPLPYILKVTWNQHASVSRWHYSDALRISGTFSLLGANEYAAFCVTIAVADVRAAACGHSCHATWRVMLAGGIACVMIGVMWSYSRTAYIALMLGAVSVVLLWRGRWKMVLPLFARSRWSLPALLPDVGDRALRQHHDRGGQARRKHRDALRILGHRLGQLPRRTRCSAAAITRSSTTRSIRATWTRTTSSCVN